ncbi:cyclin domain-containing protein, partial [Dichotomocladium elegans]
PTKLLAQISTVVAAIVECPREAKSEAHRRLPSLTNFIQQVYVKCRMTPTLLVVALVYLKRLQKKLPSGSQGEYDTPYKLYLASVVLASKFVEDSHTVARYVYRVCAPVYSANDITVMERSFLGVIK